MPGTYVLVLRLEESVTVRVGRFGPVIFPHGWYGYVGSAQGGLGARLRWHLRQSKRFHWHIDMLLTVAPVISILYQMGPDRCECRIAEQLLALSGAGIPVPRFGASDCHCPTHLVHLPVAPAPPDGWAMSPVRTLPCEWPIDLR